MNDIDRIREWQRQNPQLSDTVPYRHIGALLREALR